MLSITRGITAYPASQQNATVVPPAMNQAEAHKRTRSRRRATWSRRTRSWCTWEARRPTTARSGRYALCECPRSDDAFRSCRPKGTSCELAVRRCRLLGHAGSARALRGVNDARRARTSGSTSAKCSTVIEEPPLSKGLREPTIDLCRHDSGAPRRRDRPQPYSLSSTQHDVKLDRSGQLAIPRRKPEYGWISR